MASTRIGTDLQCHRPKTMRKCRLQFLNIVQFAAFALLYFSAVSGCFSFPGHELQRYGHEQIIPYGPKPSITYDARVIHTPWAFFGKAGNQYEGTLLIFQEEINQVFKKSGFFSSINSNEGSDQSHLTLTLYHWGGGTGTSVLLTQYYGVLFGLSIGVLPAFDTDRLLLTVEVKRDGQIVKQYHYKDSVITWYQLFLVFFMPFNSIEEVKKHVIDNMLLNLLYDLQRDKILMTGP